MKNVKNYHIDKFAVAYMKDGNECWLQTDFSESQSLKARDIVNDHEIENDRPAKFYTINIE